MNIEVTDQLIQQLTKEWLDSLPKRYSTCPKCPCHFTWRFRWRMWWFCHEADWEYNHRGSRLRWSFRTAVLIMAAILSATVAMATVRYFRLVREKHEKYSSFYYEQIEEGFTPNDFIYYTLDYVPEGFSWESEVDLGGFYRQQYVNEHDHNLRLTLRQTRIEEARFDLDTEKVEPVEITLNGTQRAWYLGNEGYKVIHWDDGEYAIQVSGHVSKDELVKIAESVHIK